MCDNGPEQAATADSDSDDSSARSEMLRKCEELRQDLHQVLVVDFNYPLTPKQSILMK